MLLQILGFGETLTAARTAVELRSGDEEVTHHMSFELRLLRQT